MIINYHNDKYRPLNGLILRSTIKNVKRSKTTSIQKGDKRMKTIAIIGAGKGFGLSLAKRFGKEGFQVAEKNVWEEEYPKGVTPQTVVI